MPSQEASPRKYIPVVNETTWRMGDPQPFRMDGAKAQREQVNTQKAQTANTTVQICKGGEGYVSAVNARTPFTSRAEPA